MPPRARVTPRVDGSGAIALEPDPPQAKDLEPKERIQTYPFTKSKLKIIDSRLGFEIESGRDSLPFMPHNSPIKCSPDDRLGQQNRAAVEPHEPPTSPSHLEATHSPPSGLESTVGAPEAAQPHALAGGAPESLLAIDCARRREAATTSHLGVVPLRVLPWVRIPSAPSPLYATQR
jgi:hypothetical protein